MRVNHPTPPCQAGLCSCLLLTITGEVLELEEIEGEEELEEEEVVAEEDGEVEDEEEENVAG